MTQKPLIALFLLLTILPIGLGVGYSLGYSLGLTGLISRGFTLAHWQALWGNHEVLSSLLYTLYITLISIVFIVGIALGVTWTQFSHHPSKSLPLYWLLPLAFPPVIAAFSWYYLLTPGGILSRLAWQLGLIEDMSEFPGWVHDLVGVGITVTHVFLVVPIFILLFSYQIKVERLKDLREMTATLGGNARAFFRRVFVPVLLRKTAPFILLYAIFMLGAYEVPLIMGRSAPRLFTVLAAEKLTLFNLQDIPLGHAMVVFYCVLIWALATLFLRRLKPSLW